MSKLDPTNVDTWYKCPNCDICLNPREKFLVHVYSHTNGLQAQENKPIFHTANGRILRITELPNTYEIFTPNIELCPLEDISRKFEIKIQQPTIKVPRLSEADFQAAIEEANKRKLRVKPKRKYSALEIHEDDFIVVGAEDQEEFDDDNYDPKHARRLKARRERESIYVRRNSKFLKHNGSARVCVQCEVTCSTVTEYTAHITEAHFKEGKYVCTVCPFQTLERRCILRHRCSSRSAAGVGPVKCLLCSPVSEWKYRVSYLKHVTRHRVEGRYPCPHCPRTTSKVVDMHKHIRREHEENNEDEVSTSNPESRKKYPKFPEKVVPCSICGKSYTKYLLKTHILMHKRKDEQNKKKPFHCAICNEGFTKKCNLQRHFQLHAEDNPFVCKFPGCGNRSSTRYVFRRHYALHYGPRELFPCKICNVEYTRAVRLAEHNKMIHFTNIDGEPLAPAEYGPHLPKPRFRRRKPVFRAKRYEEHCQSKVPPLPSPMFPQLREPAEDTPEHEGRLNIGSVHLGDDDTIKAECREAMLDVNEELEVRGITKSEEPSDVCQTPGPSVTVYEEGALYNDPVVQRLALVNPEFVKLLHRGSKYTNFGDLNAFPCKICVFPKVTYPRLHHLLSHMAKHHPEEAAKNSAELSACELSFTCGSCGFQSRTSQQLSRHMKIHNTYKFHCPTCGSRFRTQVRLDTHVEKIHMTARDHKCDKCGKAYTTLDCLRKHKERAHAPPPENPDDLICKHCGKVTSNMKSLRNHVRLHDKTRVLSYCKICNEKLSCPASLRRHIQLMHLKANKQAAREKAKEVIPESELFL